ncbi:MAG: hypothetical protein WCG79_01500 [Verrucomicrobiota bacterium]|jgi:hypothetical protein
MKNILILSPRLTRCVCCGVAVILAGLLCGQTEAMLIAEDNLGYAPGALAGDNGGTGWGGAWQVWFGSAAVNNQQLVITGNTWIYRQLAAPVTLSAGDQIWFSFVAQETTPVATFAGLSTFLGWGEKGFIGDPFQFGNTWGLQPTGLGNGSQEVNSSAPASTQSLLVARYDISTNGMGTMTLWVDPSSMAELVNQYSVATAAFIESPMLFDTIRLASGDGAMSFSDLRIGTTAFDVYPSVAAVPEPGIGILFGLGFIEVVSMRYHALKAGRQTSVDAKPPSLP